MNKSQLKKSQWYRVRLQPVPLLADGTGADDEWIIELVDERGVTVRNPRTDYRHLLGYDHIREFTTNGAQETDGLKHGFLQLKVQLVLTRDGVRVEMLSK
jgi:hypothetical protein